jgi:uncharacterized metal-binding protein YceD (DUF177 family)
MADRRFDVVSDSLEYSVSFEDLPAEGLWVSLTAGDAERSALAERLDVAEIEKVGAEIELAWVRDQMGRRLIAITGEVHASLTQICVVTLNPLPAELDCVIDLRMTDRPDVAEPDWEADHDDDDPPEYLPEGAIDLAEVIAQQLSLDINPFPRSPDLPYQDVSAGGDGDHADAPEKPFAGLAALREKLDK